MLKHGAKPWLYIGLAAALLCVHTALNAAFPSAALSISYCFYVSLSLAALVLCFWRTLRFVPGVWHQWVLFCCGLALWCVATLMAAHAQIFSHTPSDAATIGDFFYFFYGVPVLIAIAASSEGSVVPAFFWFDGIQAVAAGFLAFIAIFEAVPFSGTPLKPVSVARLVWIYDAENIALALFSGARLLMTRRGAAERRFFQIITVFLWVYLITASVYNHAVVTFDEVGLLNGIVDVPFLVLACAAILLPVARDAPEQSSLRKPLDFFIESARPLGFGLAILALGAVIARQHLIIAGAAVFLTFILYAARSAILHSRYLQAEQALRSAMQRQEELALQDGLTGVANRRCFDQRFSVEWIRCTRARAPFSLLLIDIDHFKKLNDTYGHQAGDEVLAQVGRILRTALNRPGDLLARYGGEEFVALLPETDAAGAETVAQHMRALLSGVEPSEPLLYPVTVSIGVSTRMPSRKGSAALLLETADRALYKAKQNGRNRVEVLPMPGLDPVPGEAARSVA